MTPYGFELLLLGSGKKDVVEEMNFHLQVKRS